MAKKKDSKLILFGLIGVGAYLYFRSNSLAASPVSNSLTDINAGTALPAAPAPVQVYANGTQSVPVVRTDAAGQTVVTNTNPVNTGQASSGSSWTYSVPTSITTPSGVIDYKSDAANRAKITQWISSEPNSSVQGKMRAWIATTDLNQRVLMANYWDFKKAGGNTAYLMKPTNGFVQGVFAQRDITGFHA